MIRKAIALLLQFKNKLNKAFLLEPTHTLTLEVAL